MSALGIFIVGLLCVLGSAELASAQERPYFVTYDHYLEERGTWNCSRNDDRDSQEKRGRVCRALARTGIWIDRMVDRRAVLGGCHDATRGTWIHRVAR